MIAAPPSRLCRLSAAIGRHIVRAFKALTFSTEFGKCSTDDFSKAFVELGVTTFFTTMPIWIFVLLGPMIFNLKGSAVETTWYYLRNGELLIYSAALAGPLIYIISRRYGERRDEGEGKFRYSIAFPQGLSFIVASAVICIISGFSIALIKNPIIKDISLGILNHKGISFLSIFMYLFSLYIIFCASAYRNAMEGYLRDPRQTSPPSAPPTAAASTEEEFAAAWQGKRDAG